MRRALVPTFLLLLGSIILGATVLREPLARAAVPIASVFVSNDASNPVPVREQNLDANGNVRVHEQGVANVTVNGVVATEPVQPPKSFSLAPRAIGALDIEEGCDQSLPAGTGWFISSFAAANESDSVRGATLALFRRDGDTLEALRAIGPVIRLRAYETVQLTFPQPFALTSPEDGLCLKSLGADIAMTVVGYRR
jgi:hypothetical protein